MILNQISCIFTLQSSSNILITLFLIYIEFIIKIKIIMSQGLKRNTSNAKIDDISIIASNPRNRSLNFIDSLMKTNIMKTYNQMKFKNK